MLNLLFKVWTMCQRGLDTSFCYNQPHVTSKERFLYLPQSKGHSKNQLINPKPQLHSAKSIMRTSPPTEENEISTFLMSSLKLQNFKK